MSRAFEPKPFTVGARVTWEHVTAYGTVVRSGTVWSLAPQERGQITVWVSPDEPDSGDVYPAGVVVTVGRKSRRVYSETSLDSHTGSLAWAAAQHSMRARGVVLAA